MTMSQTTVVLCILGSIFLMIIPDNTTASDKFFQTGGRFGKRHDDRLSNFYFSDLLKSRPIGNVPPRIERGFYISRYGKRNTNSLTDSRDYFTICLPFYGIYCEFTGLPNILRCKRISPMECSNLQNHDNDEKLQLMKQPENADPIVNTNNNDNF
ncbi:Hypothetical protein CINCED_3A008178 [Cinara cedri]|uniref:Uncharacterized protein n=1 Tax=Cinara cedri TaxID=506608 RepID=A0A5E4ME47_9HEMI|nr:Hypothetical protein CINCED_3A008178 [Cinara cedri]